MEKIHRPKCLEEVELGQHYRCVLLDSEDAPLRGLATSVVRNLTNSDQVALSFARDGKAHIEWIDVSRLELLKDGPIGSTGHADADTPPGAMGTPPARRPH